MSIVEDIEFKINSKSSRKLWYYRVGFLKKFGEDAWYSNFVINRAVYYVLVFKLKLPGNEAIEIIKKGEFHLYSGTAISYISPYLEDLEEIFSSDRQKFLDPKHIISDLNKKFSLLEFKFKNKYFTLINASKFL